jgi:hypothetical protein
VPVGLADEVADGVAVGDGEPDSLRVPEPVGDGVPDPLDVRLEVVLGVLDCDCVTDRDAL